MLKLKVYAFMNIFKRNKIGLIIAIVFSGLLIAMIGLSIWILVASSGNSNQATNQADGTLNPQPNSYTKAVELAQTDGLEAAQASLDEEIERTSDNSEKSSLFGSKASLETSVSTEESAYGNALDYALQAYELDERYENAALVAFYHQQLGNNTQAIEYYELAVQGMGSFDDLNPMDQSMYDYYKTSIEILQNAS